MNPGDKDEMHEMVKRIVAALVDVPSAVQVEARDKGEGTVFTVRVAPEDAGKVIGKQGRNARSIRTLLAAASMKYRHPFTLVVLDGHAHGDGVAEEPTP
jgi:hypothetical protein